MIMKFLRLTLAVMVFACASGAYFADAQLLTVKTAVELGFPTMTNTGYRISQSPDLSTWEPIGRQILGDGADVSRLFSITTTQRYFQTESFAVRDPAHGPMATHSRIAARTRSGIRMSGWRQRAILRWWLCAIWAVTGRFTRPTISLRE